MPTAPPQHFEWRRPIESTEELFANGSAIDKLRFGYRLTLLGAAGLAMAGTAPIGLPLVWGIPEAGRFLFEKREKKDRRITSVARGTRDQIMQEGSVLRKILRGTGRVAHAFAVRPIKHALGTNKKRKKQS